jgi:cytochrome P450
MATSCQFSNPRGLFRDLEAYRLQHGLPHDQKFNALTVSRYEDIISVLNRPDIFSSKPTMPPFPDPVKQIFAGKVPDKSTLLNWDNPDHDRLRLSVASSFVPRRLQRFEPAIRKLANELTDGFATDGRTDLKHSFALPLPLKIIPLVAGLEPNRWQWLGRSLTLFGGHAEFRTGSIEEQIQGILDVHEYVAKLIQTRKKDRRDDLIRHIWNQRNAGVVQMTDMEHLAMIPGLLLAGRETTTNLLSMGMSHLLHYGLWEKASRDDESRQRAIEELLWFESAITGMRCEATVDTQIGECPVSKGTQLFLAYNSGSRDTSRFPLPDVLDIDRQSHTQHLGFGGGIHACLGAL